MDNHFDQFVDHRPPTDISRPFDQAIDHHTPNDQLAASTRIVHLPDDPAVEDGQCFQTPSATPTFPDGPFNPSSLQPDSTAPLDSCASRSNAPTQAWLIDQPIDSYGLPLNAPMQSFGSSHYPTSLLRQHKFSMGDMAYPRSCPTTPQAHYRPCRKTLFPSPRLSPWNAGTGIAPKPRRDDIHLSKMMEDIVEDRVSIRLERATSAIIEKVLDPNSVPLFIPCR